MGNRYWRGDTIGREVLVESRNGAMGTGRES